MPIWNSWVMKNSEPMTEMNWKKPGAAGFGQPQPG
jgi:hypothetical protein